MQNSEEKIRKDPDRYQKFVINPKGEIEVEWINTRFSDVIIELLPEQERKQLIELNKDSPLGPKIFCG